MSIDDHARRFFGLTLALGVLGGAVLVLGNMLVGFGKFILVPYFLVVVAAIVVIRAERIAGFSHRLAVTFGAFMISSLALYLSVVLAVGAADLSFLGHLWRLALLASIGLAVSLPGARLAGASRAPA